MTDDPGSKATSQIHTAGVSTGHRVTVFAGTNQQARGEVIEDFGPDLETAEADQEPGSDSPRRWAIRTDDEMLVFANTGDIEVLTSE